MGCLFDDFFVGHYMKQPEFQVTQIAQYYPYGLPFETFYSSSVNINRNLYQGKEMLLDEYGMYDFHARHYDPALGRFSAIDPAGQFSNPYLGMGNNPVNGIDPDGRIFGLTGVANAMVSGALLGGTLGAAYGLAFDEDNWGYYAAGGALLGAGIGGLAGLPASTVSTASHSTPLHLRKPRYEPSAISPSNEVIANTPERIISAQPVLESSTKVVQTPTTDHLILNVVPEEFNGGVLYNNVANGLEAMWEASFHRSFKGGKRENFAVITTRGLLVLPNSGNTMNTSSGSLSAFYDKLSTSYDVISKTYTIHAVHWKGNWMEVSGVVHTHPSTYGLQGHSPYADSKGDWIGVANGKENYVISHSGIYQAGSDYTTYFMGTRGPGLKLFQINIKIYDFNDFIISFSWF